METSERLAQEDDILRQIRLAISTYRTVDSNLPRRRGAMYASYSITSGRRLYMTMRRLGFAKAEDFRRQEPDKFRRLVLQRNLRRGHLFGEFLRTCGWPLTIVPGALYAKGWNQEHYMSLWRRVIIVYAKHAAFDPEEFPFSNGSAEEYLVGLQNNKRLFFRKGDRIVPVQPQEGIELVRRAIDQLDAWGFDPLPLYQFWRQMQLTFDAMAPAEKTA